MIALQPALVFPSLDFPNRSSLTAHEVAARLRVTPDHVVDLIEEGLLPEEPMRQARGGRAARVSLVDYRRFIASRVRGRGDFSKAQRLTILSLEFSNERPLLMAEVASRLGVSTEHVGAFILAEELGAVDVRGIDATRGLWRIPIEAYRQFVDIRIKRAVSRRLN